MPYNPGINDRSGELLAQGIERGKQNALQVLMWAMDRSSKTKELKGIAKTAFPERADEISKMNLEGVGGFLQGQKVLSDQQSAALATQLRQAQLGQLQRGAADEASLGQALREAAGSGGTGAQNFSILPPGTGMENVFRGTVQTQGAPNPNAVVAGILRNPGAANTPAGQAVLGDWMRNQQLLQRGGPEAATVGGIPTIYNRFTGAFEIDPRYTAAAKASVRPVQTPPGTAPIYSPDRTMYWTGKEWKPVPQRKGSLFDQPTDVTGSDEVPRGPGNVQDPLGLFHN